MTRHNPPKNEVAAVVVNYNARAHLVECVRSLRTNGVDEIVVVDNGSTDGSEHALSAADARAKFVRTGSNLGYGGGANRGVALTSKPLVLIANPDTVVRRGAVDALAAALVAAPSVAAVGPRVEEPDGAVYPSARTFPSIVDSVGHGFLGLVAPRNRFTRRYRMLDENPDDGREVDWVSGACFLVRKSAFDEVGGFDERFFMYSEDVDLCWRLRERGWQVAYEPTASVVHVQGVSTARQPYRMVVAHHVSLMRFATRTTRGWRRVLLPAVAVGLGLRGALVSAQLCLSALRASARHALKRC